MTTRFSFLGLTLLLLCVVYPLSAQSSRDPAQEMPIVEQLRKISPKSVDDFIAATEAMDERRFDDAASLYRNVLMDAPEFEPAMRRQGYTFIALGRRTEGLELTKKALEKNRSV